MIHQRSGFHRAVDNQEIRRTWSRMAAVVVPHSHVLCLPAIRSIYEPWGVGIAKCLTHPCHICLQVYSTPLVGVWVKGPSSVMHPLVAAACVRFVYSTLLADRAVNPENGAFLLLLCPEGV